MSFELEVTPASEVPCLRAGFAFIIRGRTGAGVCEGRIKPSGRIVITEGSYPNAAIRREMSAIGKRYAAGDEPEDRVFASEDARRETEPAPPGLDED